MDFEIEYVEDMCVCVEETNPYNSVEKFLVGKEYEYFFTPLSTEARRGEVPPDEHFTVFLQPYPYNENTKAVYLAPNDFYEYFKEVDFILKLK